MTHLTDKEKAKIEDAGYLTKELTSVLEIYKILSDKLTFEDLHNEISKLSNFLYPVFAVNYVKNEIQVSPSHEKIKISYKLEKNPNLKRD